MGRSLRKGPYVAHHVLAKVEKQKAEGSSRPIKTWSRGSTITPAMIGCTFEVHNGKKFIGVFVSENMVGHRLGEFAPTRTFRTHGSKKAAESAAGSAPSGAASAPAPAATAAAPKKG